MGGEDRWVTSVATTCFFYRRASSAIRPGMCALFGTGCCPGTVAVVSRLTGDMCDSFMELQGGED